MMQKRQIVALSALLALMPLLTGCGGAGDGGAGGGGAAVNRAPAPTAPAISIVQNTPGASQVSPNDLDVGESFTFAIMQAPTNGTATVSASGLVTYTPNPDFSGLDSLVVTVTDNGTPPLSGTVTINITVTPAPPVPIPILGAADKGPLLNCEIRVFVLQGNGSRGVQVAGAPVTAAVITQSPSGAWNVNIPSDIPGPFVTEARGENCAYFDEATGNLQSTGNTPIQGLLLPGATTAAITPLSDALTLVVRDALAAAAAAGTATNPTVLANNVVANATQTFGFDPVRTLPPDPRNLQVNTATPSQLRYAQILGGLSQVLNAAGGDIATQLTTLAQDLTDGELDGRTALRATPTTATNLLQDARAGGLQAGNLQQAANDFANNPPTGAGLDRTGFITADRDAKVVVTATPDGFTATPAAAPQPTAANISTLRNTDGTTTVSPGSNSPPHTFRITTLPSNGQAAVTRANDDTGLVVYRPNTGFVGTDSLVVTVTNSATPAPLAGAVTIGVTVVATPPTTLTPTANPNPLVVGFNNQGVSQVSSNDPPQNSPHTFALTTAPTSGTARLEGQSGRVVYTPNSGFVGTDSLVVTVTNRNDVSGTVTINITVLSGSVGSTPG